MKILISHHLKIMSWDIEADSSHGDFPLAKKDYKKFAMELCDFYLDYTTKNKNVTDSELIYVFREIIKNGFLIDGKASKLPKKLIDKIKADISQVYLKTKLSPENIKQLNSKEFIKIIISICNKYKREI